MTAPMPETMSPREQYEQAKRDFNNMRDDGTVKPRDMSPREKVARIIDPAAFLFTADELMKGDPSQFNALAKADQIFAALASSGDHAELARLAKAAMSKSNDEICQSLGKALGYPWFKDDQRNFPGATEENGVCVGEHVAESIADEAASRINALIAEVAALRERLETARFARVEHNRQFEEMRTRATEAERKQAEADQVIRDIAETPYTGADWPRSRAATYVASKEAERG